MPSERPVAGVTPAVLVALITLYVVWGSTYLAIGGIVAAKWPLLGTASARFLLASAVFFAVARSRGPLRATWPEVWNAAVAGWILFLVSNALVMWAQTRVASGLAALLVAVTPVWITVLEALEGVRPSPRRIAGVGVGLVGVAVLVDPRAGVIDPLGALGLLGASGAWAVGSLWTKRRPMPEGVLERVGWQLGAASVALALASAAVGETWPAGDLDPRGVVGFGWLLVGGSLIGYGTYAWLLEHTPPALATTYAYVNPVVAALLGWGLAGETLTMRVVAASALVLGGVAAITSERPRTEVAEPPLRPARGA